MKMVKIGCIASLMLLSNASFAQISVSEIKRQPIEKIERVENCSVKADIDRHSIPSTPNNVALPVYGQQIIGWGKGPEEVLLKTQTLHLSDIESYQQKGVTLPMLQQWADFYDNETQRNSCNPTAPLRAELMKKIMKMWM